MPGFAQQCGDLQRRQRRIRFGALELLLVEAQEIGMRDQDGEQRKPLSPCDFATW